MPLFICATCGTQYPASPAPPERCPICEDERQFVGPDGQRWTTLEEMRGTHRNRIEAKEPGLTGIGTEPAFAIGQRALLLETPAGNVLWDCVTLLDDGTVEFVRSRGGLSAIAISHPHFYATMVEWSEAFGGVPIHLHAADREWVQRSDPRIHFWEGESHPLLDGLTLVRCGGHFPGGSVLHWAAGAEGRGALLTGDVIQVVMDGSHVSFMYSYPNLIPLSAGSVRRIVQAVEGYPYDRIYGAWWRRNLRSGAREAVHRSAGRYLRAIEG